MQSRRSVYPPSCYVDEVHLHRQASLALSLDMASILNQAPPRGRWIALPDYRDPPSALALEDFEQSRRAVFGGKRR